MVKKLIPMAICYDFDGTLSPGNMQEYDFMEALGIKNSKKFWDKAETIAKEQVADSIAAYMYLMIKASEEKDLPFKRQTFKNYGKHIELYKGVEDWFKRTTDYAREKGIALKHYIISSGIKEIIEGTKIAKNFAQIYASSFMYSPNGEAVWPAVVLNYTSKTQYLFRINKGCEDITDNTKINDYVTPEARSIPFTNMIYIGDGSTDIPCMTIVKRSGGHSIAVYKSGKNSKSRAEQLIAADRVNAVLPADYSKGKQIDTYVKAVIDKVAADEALKAENLYDKIMQLCIEQLTTANTKNGLYKARYFESDPKNEESYKITITEDEARKHINAILLPDMPKEYKTCNDIFRRFLISGQNSGRMFNLISFEKRETQFKNILGVDEQGNADYKQVIEKYVLKQNKELKLEDCTKEIRNQAAEELHSDFFKQIKGDKGQPIVTMGDKSDWRKYARLVIDAALFVGKNSRKDENSRDGDYEVLKNKLDKKLKEEGNYNLQKFIEDNIHGMGKALACDFLKEIGYDMAKPDVHIKEFIKNRLGKEIKDEEKVLEEFDKIANEEFNKINCKDINIEEEHKIYALDKLIWLCSSGKYYDTTSDGTFFKGILVEPKNLRELFLAKI